MSEQTVSGIQAVELAGHDAQREIEAHFIPRLELVPLAHAEPVYPSKRLHGPAVNQAERRFERAQAVRESLRPVSGWDRLRAEVDKAHRIEVNSTTTDNLGFPA